jgi:hypothetical protein
MQQSKLIVYIKGAAEKLAIMKTVIDSNIVFTKL